ncbi:3'-5' exonuclease [Candidatus Kapaibacterium sp.]
MNSNLNSNNDIILKGLNDKQTEAVKIINGPLLIIAGAGSGKTKVLTHRIAYIIDNGTRPSNILALTFTNKAANELKERISNLVGESKAKYIWAGTFHSIFARILRIEAKSINYSSNFSIYDTDDSASVIRQIIKTLNLTEKSLNINAVRNKISSLKNKMISSMDYALKAETSEEKFVAEIYKKYEINLKNNNAMDFDDILLNFINMLRSDKNLLTKYQEQFKYILIDEYQDTNKAQYLAIKLLSKSHNNLCVVGDDAQSIYRWRGADISNILDFQEEFPYCKVVRLEQNYRSTKNILNAAHSVISNNQRQIPKKLWTENQVGDKIDIFQYADDREEAIKVANLINDEIENGYNFKDIAILYRTNAQSLVLENSLRSKKIPYLIIGGTSFYKRKEIKDTLAYLTLLVNPSDNEAFRRVINEPPRGIGLTSLRNLELFAEYNNLNLIEACFEVDNIPEIKGKASKSAIEFASKVNEYSRQLINEQSYDVIFDYILGTDLISMFKEIGSSDALDRITNIEQFLLDIKNYFETNENPSLSDYLQQITLVSDIDDKDLTGNNVSLMTLHSAKGLEYPIVIITGVEKGLFPLERTRLDQEELEEERRLFYVGVTRAKSKLSLSYCMRRAKFGDVSVQGPSKFVSEIPAEYTNRAFSTGGSFVPQRQESYFKSKPQGINRDEYSQIMPDENYSQLPPIATNELKVGDWVKHSNFGRGKIIQKTGFGAQERVVVNFDGIGNKSLMLQFAKLTKM